MKAAVCLSGQLRNFKGCYQSLYDHIIQPTKADLFVHAWHFSPEETDGFYVNIGNDVTKRFAENGTEEEFLSLYRPKKYKFEECSEFLKNKRFAIDRKAPETNVERMMCMLYNISECFSMLDSSRYDIVFRCRTEITYDRKVNREDLSLSLKGNLIIPHGTDGREGYQDSFAFGPPSIMSIYTSLYHYIQKYSDEGEMIHPEHMLKYHLEKNKAPVERIDFPMSLRGKRYA